VGEADDETLEVEVTGMCGRRDEDATYNYNGENRG
jgi:hypothetical protein